MRMAPFGSGLGRGQRDALNLEDYVRRSVAVTRRSTRISYVVAAVVWVAAALWLGFVVQRVSTLEDRRQALARDSARLSQQVLSLQTQRDSLLAGQGWSPEQLRAGVGAGEVLAAARASSVRSQVAAASDPSARRAVTIQLFSRDVDRGTVESALRELGFRVDRKASNPAIPTAARTNAVWCSADVPTEDMKLVLLTLARAGVGITHVQPLRNVAGRSRTIQVGSSLRPTPRTSPYSVQEIESSTSFPCSGPAPGEP